MTHLKDLVYLCVVWSTGVLTARGGHTLMQNPIRQVHPDQGVYINPAQEDDIIRQVQQVLCQSPSEGVLSQVRQIQGVGMAQYLNDKGTLKLQIFIFNGSTGRYHTFDIADTSNCES